MGSHEGIPLAVNQEARRARHLKVFARAASLRSSFPVSFSSLWSRLSKRNLEGEGIRSILTPYFHLNRVEHRLNVSPSHKLFTRYTTLVAALFVVGSYNPSNAYTDTSFQSDLEGLWQGSNIESPFVADQEGYLIKVNPQTTVGDRSRMNDYFIHTVEAGETISTIAASYDLRTSTIVWANDILNANALKIGQKILIPPTDGFSHTIAKSENVDSLAKTYGISAETIVQRNSLTGKTLIAGEEIFLPGAKPLSVDLPAPAQPANRNTTARIASASRAGSYAADGAILQNSKDVPVGNKPFIYPTRGKLTTPYRAGHYAFDIADPSRPAVWAAGSGTVVKVKSGCGEVSYSCNGGYGNHIIIDHGNGLKTLYAHLTYASVKEGQHVDRGEAIGKMGRSGRVRGITGIHLHWEVILNGRKVNPSGYYGKVASK